MSHLKMFPCRLCILILTLAIPFGVNNCCAQSKAKTVDSIIKHLQSVYRDTLFADNFKDDTIKHSPLHWKINSTISDSICKPFVKVKSFKDDKVLSVNWSFYFDIEPVMSNKKPLQLPDSFTLEYDFIYEKYTETIDSAALKLSMIKKDTFERDWPVSDGPGVLHSDAIYKPDTFFKIIPVAKFSDGFSYTKWHHCIMTVRPKHIAAYVVNPVPYQAFDDSFFTFRMMSLGKDQMIFLKNIVMKTAAKTVDQRRDNTVKSTGASTFSSLLTVKKFVTRAIRFDVNKATIREESFSFLRDFSAWLRNHPDVKLEIGGHTDNTGTGNAELSQARADAIKKYLVVTGIDGARLSAKGYGATQPIETNSTPEGRAYNRRVEFKM